MNSEPSNAAKGCAFVVILLAVFGGGVIGASVLEWLF